MQSSNFPKQEIIGHYLKDVEEHYPEYQFTETEVDSESPYIIRVDIQDGIIIKVY